MFTQPIMYKKVAQMENVLQLYEKDVLKRDKTITKVHFIIIFYYY